VKFEINDRARGVVGKFRAFNGGKEFLLKVPLTWLWEPLRPFSRDIPQILSYSRPTKKIKKNNKFLTSDEKRVDEKNGKEREKNNHLCRQQKIIINNQWSNDPTDD